MNHNLVDRFKLIQTITASRLNQSGTLGARVLGFVVGSGDMGSLSQVTPLDVASSDFDPTISRAAPFCSTDSESQQDPRCLQ